MPPRCLHRIRANARRSYGFDVGHKPRPAPRYIRETRNMEDRPCEQAGLADRFHETDQIRELEPTDLILRSRAKHGVSKDRRWRHIACGRPSRRAQQSALLRTRLMVISIRFKPRKRCTSVNAKA